MSSGFLLEDIFALCRDKAIISAFILFASSMDFFTAGFDNNLLLVSSVSPMSFALVLNPLRFLSKFSKFSSTCCVPKAIS